MNFARYLPVPVRPRRRQPLRFLRPPKANGYLLSDSFRTSACWKIPSILAFFVRSSPSTIVCCRTFDSWIEAIRRSGGPPTTASTPMRLQRYLISAKPGRLCLPIKVSAGVRVTEPPAHHESDWPTYGERGADHLRRQPRRKDAMSIKVTDLKRFKAAGQPFAMLTAYDYLMATALDEGRRACTARWRYSRNLRSRLHDNDPRNC